jgi:hypothetical protein
MSVLLKGPKNLRINTAFGGSLTAADVGTGLVEFLADCEVSLELCLFRFFNSRKSCPSPSPSHIATDGLSVSKSWCRAPSGTHGQIFITVEYYGFVFCVAPSMTRGRVCLIHATGPCQHSLSRVRVPWYSWPYFTVSNLRLPFLLPPTTRRVTVEVASIILLKTPLYGPRREHRFPYNLRCFVVVECVSIAAGTYLQIYCLETALVYLLMSRSLHSNGSIHYDICNVSKTTTMLTFKRRTSKW